MTPQECKEDRHMLEAQLLKQPMLFASELALLSARFQALEENLPGLAWSHAVFSQRTV